MFTTTTDVVRFFNYISILPLVYQTAPHFYLVLSNVVKFLLDNTLIPISHRNNFLTNIYPRCANAHNCLGAALL